MRISVLISAAVIVAAIGYAIKIVKELPAVPASTSNTLSPYEIHLNYVGMKELPIRDVKEAF
jgi:hypothetical protein